MSDFWCQPGDILMYGKPPNLSTWLIDVGERMEDGQQSHEYYHCAIALDSFNKVEADGKRVEVNQIDYGKFDVYRPTIPKHRIAIGLYETRKLIGQPYDWWLIIDEALRDLTNNRIHLPEKFIWSQERHAKICSTLVAFYFGAAEWGQFRKWPRPSPEDIYLLVKEYKVKQQGGSA